MGAPVERKSHTGRWIAVAAAILLLVGGAAWWIARRLPVEEARQFLEKPIRVGEVPPATPAGRPEAGKSEQLFAQAKSDFAAGRYEQSAQEFRAVVAADPAGPHAGPAQWNLTRSELRSGNGAGALTALDTLIGHYANYLGDEAPHLREGLEYMQKNDLPDAQKSFEQMIHDQPDSEFVPLSWAMIARIHWTHGEPMETVRSFARMFASVKDRVPAYSVLANQLERYADGDKDVAETFGELAKDGPEGFRDIYKYLEARSLLEQDQFEATQKTLEELRKQFPDGDFTHIVDLEHAWNLLRNGKPAPALEIFERLEKEPPPKNDAAMDAFFDLRSELPLGIARCQLALGHYAEAAAAFQRGTKRNPHSIYTVENDLGLARAYEGMGDLDRAAAVLRKVIAEHPDEPKLWAIKQQLQRVEGRMAAK